jgi:hypothetical protein
LEKSEIVALIDALCERPLEDRQAAPSAELQAFCREAAKILSQADASAHPGSDTIADADRLTAALAELLSGSDVEAARRFVADAMLRSAPVRLDAESALAFVDAVAQSPQTAPAHLVEEMLVADRAFRPDSVLREGAGISALRLRSGSWSVRSWRMAAACSVLLVAGVVSSSVYWLETDSNVRRSAVTPGTTTEPRSVANAPAPPRPALATTQPCEPRIQAGQAVNAETNMPAEAPKAKPSGTECTPTPGQSGHEFADRPSDENEALAARQQAEAARQAATARAATDDASKVGAAQADREPGQGPARADRSGPISGTGNFNHPAATLSAPAAAPALRPAAPAAIK